MPRLGVVPPSRRSAQSSTRSAPAVLAARTPATESTQISKITPALLVRDLIISIPAAMLPSYVRVWDFPAPTERDGAADNPRFATESVVTKSIGNVVRQPRHHRSAMVVNWLSGLLTINCTSFETRRCERPAECEGSFGECRQGASMSPEWAVSRWPRSTLSRITRALCLDTSPVHGLLATAGVREPGYE